MSIAPSPNIDAGLDILWAALRNQQAHPVIRSGAAEHRLLTLPQTRIHLHRQLAIMWLRNHAKPQSRADLARLLAAAEDWCRILDYAQKYLPALDRIRPQEFVWRDMHVAPQLNQPVLYYFDMVGTFPGFYAGSIGAMPSVSTPQGLVNAFGVSTFQCLFGGSLENSVSRWMPMPGVAFGAALSHP